MPEEKADEMVVDAVIHCGNCDQPVNSLGAHVENRSSVGNGSVASYATWSCTAANWRERALKAETELAACYGEIFYTVPEAMPLIDKIKTMHGLEADALLRGADTAKKLEAVQKELDELNGKKPKAKGPKLEPIDPELGDHMSWSDFLQYVDGGDFNDDDGCADLATATHVSTISVSCSNAKDFMCPEWATHVVWYNK